MTAEQVSEEDKEPTVALSGSKWTPKCFKILRIILTLGSVSVLFYHLYTLVVRYRQEPVTIQTSTRQFQFPDIHVCPQMPFSDSVIRYILAYENSRPDWRHIQKTLRSMEETIKRYPDPNLDVHWQVMAAPLDLVGLFALASASAMAL